MHTSTSRATSHSCCVEARSWKHPGKRWGSVSLPRVVPELVKLSDISKIPLNFSSTFCPLNDLNYTVQLPEHKLKLLSKEPGTRHTSQLGAGRVRFAHVPTRCVAKAGALQLEFLPLEPRVHGEAPPDLLDIHNFQLSL